MPAKRNNCGTSTLVHKVCGAATRIVPPESSTLSRTSWKASSARASNSRARMASLSAAGVGCRRLFWRSCSCCLGLSFVLTDLFYQNVRPSANPRLAEKGSERGNHNVFAQRTRRKAQTFSLASKGRASPRPPMRRIQEGLTRSRGGRGK